MRQTLEIIDNIRILASDAPYKLVFKYGIIRLLSLCNLS